MARLAVSILPSVVAINNKKSGNPHVAQGCLRHRQHTLRRRQVHTRRLPFCLPSSTSADFATLIQMSITAPATTRYVYALLDMSDTLPSCTGAAIWARSWLTSTRSSYATSTARARHTSTAHVRPRRWWWTPTISTRSAGEGAAAGHRERAERVVQGGHRGAEHTAEREPGDAQDGQVLPTLRVADIPRTSPDPTHVVTQQHVRRAQRADGQDGAAARAGAERARHPQQPIVLQGALRPGAALPGGIERPHRGRRYCLQRNVEAMLRLLGVCLVHTNCAFYDQIEAFIKDKVRRHHVPHRERAPVRHQPRGIVLRAVAARGQDRRAARGRVADPLRRTAHRLSAGPALRDA